MHRKSDRNRLTVSGRVWIFPRAKKEGPLATKRSPINHLFQLVTTV